MRLLALDGNSIMNRAFYGIKLLTTKTGIYTNAIFGFLTMLQKLNEDLDPDAVAIAFDLPVPTFRHEMYKQYKANRKGMPDELAEQLPKLKQLLKYLGYKIVECEGFEADDILGTLANACKETSNECIIATGDRDIFQLISEKVSVVLMSTKFGKTQSIIYDQDKIKNVYGVAPKELLQVKAIQGDTSDNIPGIKGIGEKGALSLIQNYHDLDTIYRNIDALDIKPNMKNKLEVGRDNAYLSLKLGTINTNAPIGLSLDHYKIKAVDQENALKMMTDLEFFSLIDKLGLKNTSTPNLNQSDCLKFTVSADLDQLKNKILDQTEVYFLVKLDGDQQINLIAFNLDEDIIIIQNNDDMKSFLSEIFNSNVIFKTHDAKLFFSVANKYNIQAKNIKFDTLLAAYLLNPDSKDYSVDRLCDEYGIPNFNVQEDKYSDLVKSVAVLPNLSKVLFDKLKSNNQDGLLSDIELPLAAVLAKMENAGFKVDCLGIENFWEILAQKLDLIEHDIYETVGYEFNINSPKQLASALFEKLGLPGGKKTKTGYSTSADVLEKLRFEHPIVQLILEYRTLSKLKSTYCDGLIKQVAGDGRIHSIFKQTETRTGRISSIEPNLQNIPVKTEIGRELRRFFVAEEGSVLVDADYSQIELRVLAHIADDKNMIAAFKSNYDIHSITASQVFNMPIDMVTPIMRNRAKAVNFGIVYGISAFSLAQDIGVTVKDAKEYIEGYLKHYSGVAAYMESIVDKATKDGYVQTLFNRRRYLPELMSSNFNIRSFGKRVAMNMPIQGTAADIIKFAMINVNNRLYSLGLKSKLILQIHDELIIEAPYDEVGSVKKILLEEMQNCVSLKVPLTINISSGRSWFDTKA